MPLLLTAVPSIEQSEVSLRILIGAVIFLHECDGSFVLRGRRGVWGVSKHVIESEYKSVSAIDYINPGDMTYRVDLG